MPIYESLGSLSGDFKLPSVLDIGFAYAKIGISGEYAPRAIIRSEIQCRKTNTQRNVHLYKDKEDLYDMLVEFLHTIYFRYLLVNPKEKPIVVVESPLTQTVWRETLARVLYGHYEVASILLIPAHLVALAPLAIDSGLVLDVGYNEASVIPIYSGVPIVHAWQALPVGARSVQHNLKTLLAQDNLATTINRLPNTILEDITVRCCFVTKKSRAEQVAQQRLQPVEDVIYPMGGGGGGGSSGYSCTAPIVVSGRVRELAHQVQHEEDGDHLCLATMLLDAASRVTVDMRLELLSNIVVIGGGAMAKGFKARLKEELRHQLEINATRYHHLRNAQIKFHTIPGKENYAAWLGGAIYGCTEIVGMKAFTRDQYLKENHLPDWIDIRHNRAQS